MKLPSHCPAAINLDNHGTIAGIVATTRIILSLSREEKKSENPAHTKRKTFLVLIPLLTYFSASHSSQAVSPPPDGDYPDGNTAEDQNALLSLTAGTYNTAVSPIAQQRVFQGTHSSAPGRFLPKSTRCFSNKSARSRNWKRPLQSSQRTSKQLPRASRSKLKR